MKLLNRSAFAVLPCQPFVDWVNQLPHDEEGINEVLTLDEHRQEGTVYLIDEVDSEQALEEALAQHWAAMFENELAAWDEFGDHWPESRSLEVFLQWFELKPQVLALDLSQQPLMTAALDV